MSNRPSFEKAREQVSLASPALINTLRVVDVKGGSAEKPGLPMVDADLDSQFFQYNPGMREKFKESEVEQWGLAIVCIPYSEEEDGLFIDLHQRTGYNDYWPGGWQTVTGKVNGFKKGTSFEIEGLTLSSEDSVSGEVLKHATDRAYRRELFEERNVPSARLGSETLLCSFADMGDGEGRGLYKGVPLIGCVTAVDTLGMRPDVSIPTEEVQAIAYVPLELALEKSIPREWVKGEQSGAGYLEIEWEPFSRLAVERFQGHRFKLSNFYGDY